MLFNFNVKENLEKYEIFKEDRKTNILQLFSFNFIPNDKINKRKIF